MRVGLADEQCESSVEIQLDVVLHKVTNVPHRTPVETHRDPFVTVALLKKLRLLFQSGDVQFIEWSCFDMHSTRHRFADSLSERFVSR